MFLEVNFFRYKQVLHNLALFLFVALLLPSLINEKSRTFFQGGIQKGLVSPNLMF